MNGNKEDDMDEHLWTVLEKQRVDAHHSTEGHWLAANGHLVVDTEGVEHGRDQHVLTDETGIASSLDVR